MNEVAVMAATGCPYCYGTKMGEHTSDCRLVHPRREPVPELAWTDKKPTEPGDYLYCESKDFLESKSLRLTASQLRGGNSWLFDGHWLGPLPEVPK